MSFSVIVFTPHFRTLLITAHFSAFSSLVVYLTLWVVVVYCCSLTRLTHMLFACSTSRKRSRDSCCVYEEQYPRRHLPHHTTLFCDDGRLRETGTLLYRKPNSGRRRPCLDSWFEEDIFEHLAELPSTCSRSFSRDMGVRHDSIHLHPYDP
jgi:hypothetical protein